MLLQVTKESPNSVRSGVNSNSRTNTKLNSSNCNISIINQECLYFKQRKKINDVRTNLLITMGKEVKQLKEGMTKINSRTLSEAEEVFSSQNDQVVVLKMEKFSSECDSNKGEAQASQGRYGDLMVNVGVRASSSNRLTVPSMKSSFNSLISDSESSLNSIDSSRDIRDTGSTGAGNSDLFLIQLANNLSRKTSISAKKIEFFNQNILLNLKQEDESSPRKKVKKIPVEEKIEYINTDKGFFKNKKTRERTELGFKYLRNLCRKYKKRKKQKKTKMQTQLNNLVEMLSIKDNVDLEEMDHLNLNSERDSRLTNLSQRSTNKSKVERRDSNFIFMLNGEVLDDNHKQSKAVRRNTEKRSTFSYYEKHKEDDLDNLENSSGILALKNKKQSIKNGNDLKLNYSFGPSRSQEFSIKLSNCK